MSKHLLVKRIERIRKHKYILQKIAEAKPSKRKKMLSKAPNMLFTVIKDLCILMDNGLLDMKYPNRHSETVQQVAKRNLGAIKGMVKQKGGVIGSIIAAAVPFLVPLLSKIFK